MKSKRSDWRPGEYKGFCPDRAVPTGINVKRVTMSIKDGRSPLIVVEVDVWSLQDGTRLWTGASFHPFGVSDRLDDRTAALVEFLHEAAGRELRGAPDWKSLSNAVRWRRFIGSLQKRGDYKNLMSLQCWGETIEDQDTCLVWSADGRCFSGAHHTSKLVSIDDLESDGGGSTGDVDEDDDDEVVIEDDEEVPPAHLAGRGGRSDQKRPSLIQVADDDEDDGL